MEASLRIRHRCSCGEAFDATSEPPDGARDIYAMWLNLHEGPEHRRLEPGEPRRHQTTEVTR